MAKSKPQSRTEEPTAVEEAEPEQGGDAFTDPDPQLQRPPQGIVVRMMNTGDPKLDTITRYKRPRIDPASLIVDEQDPFVALTISGDPSKVRIRQVKAEHASELLSCDAATGAQSTYRLATDREVEAYHAEAAKRAAGQKPRR